MISVLLPTVRPHLIKRATASIRASTVPIEVVVVADFSREPGFDPGCQWQWIERPRAGVVDAVNAAYDAAHGDWVFLTNDETELGENCLDLLWSAIDGNAWQVLSPRHEPPYNFVYYGRQFVPFLFAPRGLVAVVGGGWLLDPRYKGFYADPDFSLRVLEAGYPIRVAESAAIAHRQDHDYSHAQAVSQWLEADRAAFRARWDHLGEFRDP